MAKVARVLIADNDDTDRSLMEKAFEDVFPRAMPEFVRDGRDVIEHLRSAESWTGLILLDVSVQGTGAFAVLEWLQRHPGLAGIPVFVTSGASTALDQTRALALGAKGCLTKPHDFEGMRKFVANMENYCFPKTATLSGGRLKQSPGGYRF
jgi:CheY-like chemotaxis protein